MYQSGVILFVQHVNEYQIQNGMLFDDNNSKATIERLWAVYQPEALMSS